MKEAILLVMGWAIGLLTSPIAEYFSNRRLASSLIGPLNYELRDLRDRSAAHYWALLHRRSALKRSELQWVLDALAGANLERSTGQVSRLKKFLELTDEQIAVLFAGDAEKGSSLRKVELPFLAAHLDNLHIYTAGTQHVLLKIVTDLRLYNQLVDEVRKYHDMTFGQSIQSDNYQRVVGNLHQAEDLAARVARNIADEAGVAAQRLNTKGAA